MRLVGFVIFILGLILKLWWITVIGFIVYELPGTVWLAAMLSDTEGFRSDQGPLN